MIYSEKKAARAWNDAFYGTSPNTVYAERSVAPRTINICQQSPFQHIMPLLNSLCTRTSGEIELNKLKIYVHPNMDSSCNNYLYLLCNHR